MRTRTLLAAGLLVLGPLVTAAAPAAPATASSTHPARTAWTNECWSSDRGDPVLRDVSVDQASIDTSLADVTQTFRVVADDTGGPGPAVGISKVELEYAIPGVDGLAYVRMTKQADGTWAGTRPFFRRAYRLGQRQVANVALTDGAGNVRVYRRGELHALGEDVTFTLTHDGVDLTPPELVELAVSPLGRISTTRRGRTVTVRAHLRDDTAVVDADMILNHEGEYPLSLVQGNHADGWWQTRFRIPRAASEQYTVELFASDSYGHNPFFDYAWLDRHHVAYRIDPASKAVDGDDPQLGKVVVRPEPLVLRAHDASATVTVHASDAGTGIVSAFARLRGPRAWTATTASATRVAGTDHAGRWNVRLRLPHCGASSGRSQLWVTVTDRVGRSMTVTRKVSLLSIDRRRPHVESGGVEAGDDPLVLRFDEAVTGLDPNTLRVVAHDDGDVYGQGPTVAGTWTCRNGGAAVDCATGAVRVALFAPAQAWVAGLGYGVDLLPNAVAGVHDLAGNPVLTPLTDLRTLPQI